MTILKPWAWIILIVALILLLLIYILKPNFQQKFISSTFIWKLSLKFKKKKLPISKLRNILLIICQVLIICLLSIVILKPVKALINENKNEVILILDTSASMRTSLDEETRFERACDLLKDQADEVLDAEGIVSVVIACNEPYFLAERMNASSKWQLDKLIDDFKADFNCTYGVADLSQATKICQDILIDNPATNIYVYTDVTVDYVTDEIKVVNVSKAGENNIAIKSAYAEIIDNYYSFTVTVASYGQDVMVDVKLDVSGSNATDSVPDGFERTFIQTIELSDNQEKRVVFINSNVDINNFGTDENTYYYQIDELESIYSYESVHVSIDCDDSFIEDNSFEIYGGTKEKIKVLYASSASNPFVNGVLEVLKSAYLDNYNIQLSEFKSNGQVPTSGYDVYIYEHTKMPSTTPTDGLVIYIDPQQDANSSGFHLRSIYDFNGQSLSLTEEMEHPLINNMVADNITVSRYTTTSSIDADYQTLMSCDGNPIIMFRDNEDLKSVVCLFDLHYSNLPLLKEFPIFMYNIFEYFLPVTIEGNSFEVNDKVTINSRSSEVVVSGYGDEQTFTTFPNTLSLDIPGTYQIYQNTYFGKEVVEDIYVKLPESEMNIFQEVETIVNPVQAISEDSYYEDLLFWFAVGLATLVFVEWILKGKDTL